MNLHYMVVIQWSDEDNCYLVHLPDFHLSSSILTEIPMKKL
jgi:predicted RNase H-like HicB family nuclease